MNLVYIYGVILLMMEFDKKVKVIGDFLKHSEACKELLESFASASAGFMFCTLQNARPVHICCSCVEDYNNVLQEHNKITQLKNNSSCNEKLINQDRLEVIENGFSYVKDLWMRGQCKSKFLIAWELRNLKRRAPELRFQDFLVNYINFEKMKDYILSIIRVNSFNLFGDCFENKTELSNTTKEFINLYSDINNCIESQYNPTNKSYNPDVCHVCSEKYYKMSSFYAKLKETTGNGNVCMDIVDSVNVTQHLWSNVLHCGETIMTIEIPLIAISTAFIIIPIIFYLCAWMFTKDRSSAVLNQNRISQRFRERWRSRTGSSISS